MRIEFTLEFNQTKCFIYILYLFHVKVMNKVFNRALSVFTCIRNK